MTETQILILLGLGVAVAVIVWLTPTRKPDFKNFRKNCEVSNAPPPPDVGDVD